MPEIVYSWDENKRQKTLKERGLDFAHMSLFEWDRAQTKQDIREDYKEPRFLSIGRLMEGLVVVVWCYRDNGIRIISLRKANNRERSRYERQG